MLHNSGPQALKKFDHRLTRINTDFDALTDYLCPSVLICGLKIIAAAPQRNK